MLLKLYLETMPGHHDSRDDDAAAAAEEAFVASMDALQVHSCPRLLARAVNAARLR